MTRPAHRPGVRRPRRRTAALLAGALALALGVGACAPGGGGDDAATTAPSSVVTDPAKIGRATITVLDTWADASSPLSRWFVSVQKAFMATYPDITVKRQTQTFDDLNKTIRLKLAEDDAPDIVPANNGWQGIGTLSKAKLILNLDPYRKAYGWDSRLPATIARQHEVGTDGSAIGTGSLYGVPTAQGAFITVYYNRATLQKLGLEVPTTLPEFEAALAKAKAGGVVPMELGAQDQWQTTATLFALQDAYGDPAKIGDFVYKTADVKLADTGMTQAAETYQKWSKAGYFPSDYAGVGGGDAAQKFVDGSGLFFFYYSDSLPFKDAAEANEFGTFLLPTADGKDSVATGAASQNFSIAANSEHPDAAALFLDFVSSAEAGELAVKQGVMPFLAGTYEAGADQPLLADEIATLKAVQGADGYVPYFDWSSPTMLATVGAQMQLLLAGKATPDQLVEAAQTDYDKFHSEQ